jgi:hypothetical protein
VANPLSWPDEPNNKAKANEGQVAYLPPEEIENLRNGVKKENTST